MLVTCGGVSCGQAGGDDVWWLEWRRESERQMGKKKLGGER